MKRSIPIDEKRAAIKAMEFPFCYYGYIIDPDGDVDHLHLGLWKDGTTGIKQAQENLSSLLLGQIPNGVQNILDVGCGLGTTAHELATRGYRVVGISPDAQVMDLARRRYAETDGLHLLTVAFEAFAPQEKFDLMLLQESSQYINIDLLFSKAKGLLRSRGYLLMCDEVRYPGNDLPYGHLRGEIVAAAARHGFRLIKSDDITQGILETRRFGREQLKERRAEIIRVFAGSGRNVEGELTMLEQGWVSHDAHYEAGGAGYEWFLFRKKSGMRDTLREWLKS